MKTKLLFILFSFFVFSITYGQESIDFNRINGEIKAPIIVVETINNDDFKYNQFDKTDTYADKSYQVHTSLHNIPIMFSRGGKSYTGSLITKTDFYDIISNIHVAGYIDTESKLGEIIVKETITQKKDDHEVNFQTIYEYTGLRMGVTNYNIKYNGNKKGSVFTFLVGKSTQLTVKKYFNWEQSKSSRGINTHTFELTKLDEEKLEECRRSSFPCFNFSVYWDGKTEDDLLKESMTVTQVRGEDPNWEPPSVSYLREGVETEPNSIGVYFNKAKITNSLNNELTKLLKDNDLGKGLAALIIADLSKVPGLKVLERQKIDKIRDEIELSESGLVKENSKVENKLMKEEIEVKLDLEIDQEKNQFTTKFNVASKNKEILITTNYLPLSEFFKIQKEVTKEIIKEVNKQFNMNVNPEIITTGNNRLDN